MTSPGRASVLAALVFTLGLLFAPSQPSVILIILFPAGALLLAGLSLRFSAPRSLRTLSLLLVFFAAGYVLHPSEPDLNIPDNKVWVQGTVRIPVERYDDRLRYRLSLHHWWAGERGGELDHGAVLYLPDSLGVRLQPGEEVRMIARMDPFRGPRNPGDIDWRGYWSNRNVQLMLRSVRVVEPLGVQRFFGGWTRRLVGGWRSGIDETIRDYLTPASQPLAQALLIGDRSHWEDTLRDRVALSGLMHLFAISGLHVGLIVLIAISALSWLGLGPRITSLLALPVLIVLVPLTGANPPVVRAAIIIAVAVVGRALQRNADSFHILALAYLLLLVLRPDGLHDPGFQLSFAGAAGSLYAGTHYRFLLSPTKKFAVQWRRNVHRWSRRIVLAFVVSLYAWLFTAPVLVAHFGRIALLGPVVTLPALLAVTFALAGGWLMVVTSGWPWLASVFGAAMDVLLRITDWLAGLATQHLPVWDFLPSSAVVVALLVLAVVLLGTQRAVRQPLSGWPLVALAAAVIVVYGSLWLPDSRVKLAVLDVGQGDGVLIRSGDRAILIDTGPEYSTAAVDQLRRLGIRELDLLLLSHGDADHCAAVPELVEEVAVKVALVGPGTTRDRAGANAVRALRDSGTDVRVASAGLTISGPWGELECLYPPDAEADSTLSDNALSAVWLWRSDGASAIFAGDTPREIEWELVEAFDLPDIDLLLGGHHGSRWSTSELWLRELRPELVVFSSGRNNPHGHPANDVLDRVRAIDAGIYRTDQTGALLFEVREGSFRPIDTRHWW